MVRWSGVLPAVIVAALIFGALAADRAWLHWYVPDQDARIDAVRIDAEVRANALGANVEALSRRVDLAESNLDNLNSTSNESVFDDEGFLRDVRISNAVTILSLLNAYGGFQSTTSAAGQACSDYLMFGEGGVTECGFQRAE